MLSWLRTIWNGHPWGELPPIVIVDDGWLAGPGVERIPSHASWLGGRMRPRAIVAHYTATDPGTARNMARRRTRPFVKGEDRAASWHITVESDGNIIQQAALTSVCWHAGSPTVKPIPGIGTANYNAIGVELVGHGKVWPDAQVEAAARLWRTLVSIGIAREHAMVAHAELDPTRRPDPGPLWLKRYAPRVLAYAYDEVPRG